MRYLLSICSVALASAGDPEPPVVELVDVESSTNLAEFGTTTEPTVSSNSEILESSVESGSDDEGSDDTVTDEVTVVAVNPLLGEFMTELILNIENAIDNYAFEIAVAEAVADAETTPEPSEATSSSFNTTSIPGDSTSYLELDTSTETTSSTTSASEVVLGTTDGFDATESVAV